MAKLKHKKCVILFSNTFIYRIQGNIETEVKSVISTMLKTYLIIK